MADFFYNLIIFPIVQIIELSYLFVYRVFENHGISVIGVSAAVTVLTLPLYFIAEKWQQIERNTVKRLKPKIDKIKAAFSGDEQYMILSAFYRQNHYHPVYAMRSTFGLLIQIPFFIAAYSYLSGLEVLKGASFPFIHDLGSPDGLLTIGGISLNLLPILMTLINIVSGIIYTKGFQGRDKIQLYATALVFLLLLYNSPSGLALYWTVNNLFSLIKNLLVKTKHPQTIVFGLLCLAVLAFDIFVIFFHDGYIVKRIFVIAASSVVFFLPFFKKLFYKLGTFLFKPDIPGQPHRAAANTGVPESGSSGVLCRKEIFIFSSLNLALLIGAVIPSALIASSTQEFSYIEPYSSPFPFIFNTLNQALGLFMFWPGCIYFLFSGNVKKILVYLLSLLLVFASINAFLFPGNYGFITTTLVLSNPGTFFSDYHVLAANILCLLGAVVLFSYLAFSRFDKVITAFHSIVFTALLGMTVFNFAGIGSDFAGLRQMSSRERDTHSELLKPVFEFSKEGKNVVVIMMDRAISAYVPFIFEEKPDLHEVFSGFSWYPNCVSYGKFTIFGAPPLFGGYEYVPLEMQKRNTQPLIEKYNESLLVLPKIFLDARFKVTVTDPPWSNFSWKPDLRIYDPYPEIHAENISGKYSSYWLGKHPEAEVVSTGEILKKNLIRFAVFKSSPVVARTFIFDRGKWLAVSALNDDIEGDQKLTISTINEYSVLDLLPVITAFGPEGDRFWLFTNQLTHEPAFFQAPGYVPRLKVTETGDGQFSQDSPYHANMAAFLLLGKWFTYLKDNNVYNNTRIIIVSDHGWNVNAGLLSQVKLPEGQNIQNFNPLLMIKDFNAAGDIKTDYAFMTNADVPLLALDSLVQNPVNPFTHRPLGNEKSGKIILTSSNELHPTDHGKYTFKISGNAWLSIHDNIFDPANWRKETIEE
jgi:YidC/Oxa1 family membrane protein insertase